MNKHKAFQEELQGVDAALRRAAQAAKKLAEQNGTPYVVSREASNGQFVNQNKNDAKTK